jgi:chorismate dehydratase
MEPIRIACVRYLNTVPLIEGLEKLEGISLVPVVPSHIAPMVHRGEADVGLVSLIDAARRGPEGAMLALVPAGMIGCDGATLTVRVFSSVPLGEVRAIHADTDSHTSVALAQVIFGRRYGRRVEIVDFDARERVVVGKVGSQQEGSRRGAGGHPEEEESRRGPAGHPEEEEWPETLLLIGDKVVTDSPPAVRYPYQLDLGEAWKEWTGLPFVYAMWACREEEAGSARIAAAAKLLDRQLRHNRMRMDWIVAKHALEHRWPRDLAARYLGSYLRYEVGPREREAAERFIAEAASLGLVDRVELRWVEEAVAAG